MRKKIGFLLASLMLIATSITVNTINNTSDASSLLMQNVEALSNGEGADVSGCEHGCCWGCSGGYCCTVAAFDFNYN